MIFLGALADRTRWSAATVGVLLALILTKCIPVEINPPPDLELVDPVLCQGWDAEGNPAAIGGDVPSDETEICICGQLRPEQDVFLQISWVQEEDDLLRRRHVFRDGPLLSCIRNDEGFDPGDYRVTVQAERGRELASVEFVVSEEPRR